MKVSGGLRKNSYSRRMPKGIFFKLNQIQFEKKKSKKPKLISSKRRRHRRKRQGYIIFSQEHTQVSAEQLEAARKIVRRSFKKKRSKVFVCVYPYLTLTKKPSQTRMGGGKGSKSGARVCFVKPGKNIFKFQTSAKLPKRFLNKLVQRISLKLKINLLGYSIKDIIVK